MLNNVKILTKKYIIW